MNDESTISQASMDDSCDYSKLDLSSHNSELNDPLVSITYEKEFFLRRLFLWFFQTSHKGQRIIYSSGDNQPSNYITNKVNNQKYTLFTFLPLFLFHQYKYFINLYILLLVIAQLYPPVRIGYLWVYIFPLAVILTIALIKEFFDEYNIMVKDKQYNNQTYQKFSKNGVTSIYAKDIRAGDIIVLKKGQRIPADMVLLYTKDDSGSVFVGTDQLDGETDWKIREAIKFTQKKGKRDINDLLDYNWRVLVDEPNDQIYSFKGSFYCEDEYEYSPIDLNQTVWANMKMNSNEAHCLVIYTGKETRMSKNSNKSIAKKGKTDEETDGIIKVLFVFLIVLSFGFFFLAKQYNSDYWYVILIKCFVLFSTIIPNSIKVNQEFAKFKFCTSINNDKSIKGTIVRNSSIPEELGRIQYLLTDKTGTLTQNQMILKRLHAKLCCFGSGEFSELKRECRKAYNKRNSVISNEGFYTAEQRELIKNCLLCFVLCNNVFPKFIGEERSLQASSPDEIALVEFAERTGFKLLSRSIDKITIITPEKKAETYTVLDNFPFKSETKKMGIILRNESTKEILFFVKGADIVIQEKVNFDDKLFIEEEANKLSREGLRTLAMCVKHVDQKEYSQFKKNMKEASKDLRNREQARTMVLNDFEKEMDLLCVTGVEDTLQKDVKATIQNIREAGIRVWLLTGDKLETTKCIAISTGFKLKDQNFFEIDCNSVNEITKLLTEFDSSKECLIVLGSSLQVIFKNESLKKLFFKKAKKASSVILCRCSPKQKTMIASYIKNQLNKVVCAIGDGGNDVGMIQTSSIGIGIEGLEGKQASMASDFSITRFKNIQKLFLWHGRLNYTRMSTLTHFVTHRTLLTTIFQLQFMILYGNVLINFYNPNLLLFYATFFTNCSVLSIVWNTDISLEQAYNYPSLYYLVQKGRALAPSVFLYWIWKTIFQAGMVMLLTIRLFDMTYREIVTITFTAILFIEFLNLYSIIRRWHFYFVLGNMLSILSYLIVYCFFRQEFGLTVMKFGGFQKVFLIALACWLPIHIGMMIKRVFYPSQIDKVIMEAKLRDNRSQLKI